MQETKETQVQSLGWKDPLEKKWPLTPVSYLGNPMDRETWQELKESWTQLSAHKPELGHGSFIESLEAQ